MWRNTYLAKLIEVINISKEALSRIKINKLLEEAGWRIFDNEEGLANIRLEPNVKLTQKEADSLLLMNI